MHPGWSKAQPELRCICWQRQLWCVVPAHAFISGRTLSARKWLLWKGSSDRRTCWEKVTDQSLRREMRPPTPVPHLQQSHVEWLFSMSSKYDETHKSAAQIPGVYYHAFNWLAMSPAWGTCHEILNKTWLAEEESSDCRKAQLEMASQRMQMCDSLSGPDTCRLSGVREVVIKTIRCR